MYMIVFLYQEHSFLCNTISGKKFCTLGRFGEFYLNLERTHLMLYIVVSRNHLAAI